MGKAFMGQGSIIISLFVAMGKAFMGQGSILISPYSFVTKNWK